MENSPGLSKSAYGGSMDAQIAASCPGMAHFALTGPANKACHHCEHWGNSPTFKRKKDGRLRRRTCQRFIRMCQVKNGIPIEPDTPSCRHFQHRDVAPDLVKVREPKAKKLKAKRSRP